MNLRRAPIEERIAARQRELGPLKSSGKHFEYRPAAIVFAGVIGMVVLTHIVAIAMAFWIA